MIKFKEVKKKSKIKKNEKKEWKPIIPIDETVQAQNNLREMIREAHKIHKDHIIRTRNGSLKSAAEELTKKFEENRNRSSNNFDHHKKQKKIERSKRTDEIQEMSEKTRPEKSRYRDPENGKITEKSSRMFAKPKKKVPASNSAKIQSQRKQPASSDLSNIHGKMEIIDNQFTDLKFKYYQLDPISQPFVLLNLLDEMKCHGSDMHLRPKKGISRQKKRSITHSSLQAKVKASDEKNKQENEKESNDISAKEEKQDAKKASAKKSESEESKTILKQTEKASDKEGKSKPSENNSKGDSLKRISATGSGDPFSSNNSRFYFISESDTSKIDKKFIQLIESVTQCNPKIDTAYRVKEKTNPSQKRESNSALCEGNVDCGEVQENLLRKIKSLKRALQLKTPNSRELDKNGCTSEKSKVEPSEIQELYVKENTFHEEASTIGDGKEEHEMCLDPKKEERLDPEETRESGLIERKPEGTGETEIQNPKGSYHQIKGKPVLRADDKKRLSAKEVFKQKAESPKQVREDRNKFADKPVEAWSVIRRLEKAFQTLGLNLDELESSDDDGKFKEKKKQPRLKKQELSGKEGKSPANSETLKKVEQVSARTKKTSVKRHPDFIQFGIESNGSGDKNMEHKPVRNSQKTENLKRVVKKVKDRNENNVYHAAMKNDLMPESVFGLKTTKTKQLKKKYSLDEAHENVANPKKFRMKIKKIFSDGLDIGVNRRKHFKNGRSERKVHDDNLYEFCRSLKHKSENSLSLSCSFTSLSEDDKLIGHKRKRSLFELPENNTSQKEIWKMKTTGTGDTAAHIHPISRNRAFDKEMRKSLAVRVGDPSLTNTNEMLKMEEENNAQELKNIRERHKQIISEIKSSLDEIRKQHNLFTKLRVKTKKFNKDCHAKRKLLAAYLKDVERTYEDRRGRRTSRSRCKRALSTDSYYYKISDHDLRKNLRENPPRNLSLESICSLVPNRNESSIDDICSDFFDRMSNDYRTTEEEEYRSMRSIYRRKNRRTGMLYLGWKNMKENFPAREWVPSYLIQFMDKHNKVTITEKNQLEDLVIKASGTSDSSSHSNKLEITESGKQSRSWFNHPVKHREKVEEANRVNSENYRTSSSESIGCGPQKHQKHNMESGKKSSFKDIDRENPQSKSRSLIQGDPGGRSADSLPEAEREFHPPESSPNRHKNDPDYSSIASCENLERQAEEVRYRKGDPSFRTRCHWLRNFGEHSRLCRRKTPEEERAQKRKAELERILQSEEKGMKRPFVRDFDGHILDYESHSKEKHFGHGKHRQKSIIIDHDRGEENEESQTVLGHACRHNSFARCRKKPHEYLRREKKSETNWCIAKSKHDLCKMFARSQHTEELPVNYLELVIDDHSSFDAVSKDVDCQTDNIEDCDDIGEICSWDDSRSNN